MDTSKGDAKLTVNKVKNTSVKECKRILAVLVMRVSGGVGTSTWHHVVQKQPHGMMECGVILAVLMVRMRLVIMREENRDVDAENESEVSEIGIPYDAISTALVKVSLVSIHYYLNIRCCETNTRKRMH